MLSHILTVKYLSFQHIRKYHKSGTQNITNILQKKTMTYNKTNS